MQDKPLKHNDLANAEGATDSNRDIADFPLGSTESRAAARALLQSRSVTPSEYDADALKIYMVPAHFDTTELSSTAIYARGRELHDEVYGQSPSVFTEGSWERHTEASGCFQVLHFPANPVKYAF